jgi:hypothetical protein
LWCHHSDSHNFVTIGLENLTATGSPFDQWALRVVLDHSQLLQLIIISHVRTMFVEYLLSCTQARLHVGSTPLESVYSISSQGRCGVVQVQVKACLHTHARKYTHTRVCTPTLTHMRECECMWMCIAWTRKRMHAPTPTLPKMSHDSHQDVPRAPRCPQNGSYMPALLLSS